MVGQPALEIDLTPLHARAIVADIVYIPLETPLLAAARTRGLRAVEGLGMLLHQAAPGFERWFGVRPLVTPELRALIEDDILKRPGGSAMIVVGLTGSIAMGKSTVAAMFTAEGAPVFDSDAAVHALYRSPDALAVEAAFPGVLVEGVIDRDRLGQRVLGDSAALARLEAIVHPEVAAKARRSFCEAPPPGARSSWSTFRCCSNRAAKSRSTSSSSSARRKLCKSSARSAERA